MTNPPGPADGNEPNPWGRPPQPGGQQPGGQHPGGSSGAEQQAPAASQQPQGGPGQPSTGGFGQPGGAGGDAAAPQSGGFVQQGQPSFYPNGPQQHFGSPWPGGPQQGVAPSGYPQSGGFGQPGAPQPGYAQPGYAQPSTPVPGSPVSDPFPPLPGVAGAQFGAPQGQFAPPGQFGAPGSPGGFSPGANPGPYQQGPQAGQFQQGPAGQQFGFPPHPGLDPAHQPGPFGAPPGYGAPSATPQPTKGRSPLVIGGIAVAALLVVVLGTGLVWPRWMINTVFDQAKLQEGVTRILTQYNIGAVSAVKCPAGQPVRAGATFTCSATIAGVPKTVQITVKSDDGVYEVPKP